METKHTPEPWMAISFLNNYAVVEPRPKGARFPYTEEEIKETPWLGTRNIAEVLKEENALRIVACVNACAGIPTEALEAGVVAELVEALQLFVDINGPNIDHFGEGAGPGEIDSVRKGRAALTKAKGETACSVRYDGVWNCAGDAAYDGVWDIAEKKKAKGETA